MVKFKSDGRHPQILPPGKLRSDLLGRLLRQFKTRDKGVILGPAVGEDAAILSVGGRLVAAATDPITFVSGDVGWYAVVVNANDVATRGARPRWFLCSALFPSGRTSAKQVGQVFRQIRRACRAIGVSCVGGHCEIAAGLKQPLLVGCMLGEVIGKSAVATSGARAGDRLILTKSAALEAASVIAREKREEVRRDFGPEFLRRCLGFVRDLCVVPEALRAIRAGSVHAMHDPTEGGISTGLYEMARASGVRLVVDPDRIPVSKEAERLCSRYRLNPWGALSSGALLVACPQREAARIATVIREGNIQATEIGRAESGPAGVWLARGGRREKFPEFDREEIARLPR